MPDERVLFITVERGDGHAILRLEGDFDTGSCPRFREELENVVRSGLDRLVVDLWKVRLMTSTALGALVECSKSLANNGGGLAVAHPSRFCREIIDRVGLERLVSVFDTSEAAVAHLQTTR